MNKWMKAVPIVLISFYFILVFVLDFGSSIETDSHKIKKERLELEKEEVLEEIKQEDKKIAVFLKQENGVDQLIDSNKNERKLIKEERYEKISDIDSSDNIELYRFFANFKTNGSNH